MIKTRLRALGFASIFAVVAVQSASAQTTTLKVHHFLPATSNAHTNLIKPWCDKINKDSNGRLQCQIYPAMQLGGTPAQLFDQARDGAVDIVWTVLSYQAGRFTKSEVFELPFLIRSAEEGSRALWAYMEKNSKDELRGVHPIFMHVHDGAVLHSTSKSVATLEDLKGLKIRAANRVNAVMLTALGATPVQMPLPQVPESMTKGVVDGAMVPWEGVPAVKFQEIAKFSLETPADAGKFSNSIFAFVMNENKYKSLPADLQKVIDENGGIEMSGQAGRRAFDDVVEPFRKQAIENGVKVTSLSQDELKRWQAASEKVYDAWFAEIAKKGGDGKRLLQDARELLEKNRR